MAAARKVVRHPQKLPLIRALVSLSILGTLWRTAIAAAVVLVTSLIVIAQAAYIGVTFTHGASPFTVLADGYLFHESLKGLLVFVLAFFIYDALYVGIVNRYQMRPGIDSCLLFGLEGIVLSGILMTVIVSTVGYSYSDWRAVMAFESFLGAVMLVALLAALLLPVLRAVIGVSWVMSRVQVRRKRA